MPSLQNMKSDKSFDILRGGGSEFTSFKELPHLTRPGYLYVLASFSKQGCLVPVAIELSQNTVQVNIVKSTSLSGPGKVSVHGCCLVRPSFEKKWKRAPRLVSIEENGQMTVYKCETNLSEESKKLGHYKDLVQLKAS